MKKKILIVVVAVAMMIPLFALSASAAQVALWPDAIGDVESVQLNVRSIRFDGTSDAVSLPMTTNGFTLYRIYIDENMFPTTFVDDYFGDFYNSISEGVVGCVLRLYDGNEYVTYDEYDAVLVGKTQANANGLFFKLSYSYSSSTNACSVSYNAETGFTANFISNNGIPLYEGAYIDLYVNNLLTPLLVESSNTADVEVYNVVNLKHFFVSLIELMFDNFSRIIGGLAAGITGAFTALIWENPEATEKSLSTLAKFIFTIAGLSIGMAVFYMVLRLIRFGRQR